MLHFGTESRHILHALLWTITVPNMNKINPFFSDIYITTNTQNVWKNCFNYSNFTQSQLFVFTSISNTLLDYCTKYEQNQPIFFRYITTNTQNVWKYDVITQMCNKFQCYFTCISKADWQTKPIPIFSKFHNCKSGNNNHYCE